MKMKSILLSMLAVATLASCNKDDASAPDLQGTSKMNFKISVAKNPQTRAIEDEGTEVAPTITALTVKLKNGATVLETRVLTTEQVVSAQNGGTQLEQIPSGATSVQVIGNAIAGTGIADYQIGQMSVPYTGEDNITDNGTAGDGHALKTATVTMAPAAARIEIVGGINVSEAVNGVYAVDVTEVYISNYRMDINTANLYSPAGNNGNWIDPQFTKHKTWDAISINNTFGEFYATDHNIGIVAGKAAAYQVFAASGTGQSGVEANCPHIVLRVKVYLKQADYPNTPIVGEEWITIRSFTTGGNLINSFVPGNIYKLDLSSLTSLFKPNATDPDQPETPTDPNPEADKSDLTLSVTVTPWTAVDMTPNI